MEGWEEKLTENNKKRSLPRKMARLLGKLLAWSLAVLVALLALAWIVFVVFFPDDKIRVMLTDELSSRLGVQVTAAELDLEIFSGLSLRRVEIAPPEGFERPPVKVERLVMDYSLADILNKRLVVHSLIVDRPQINLVESGGRTNLSALLQRLPADKEPGPAAEQTEKGGFILDLEKIELRDARLNIVTPDLQADLAGLQATVSGRLGAPGQSHIEAHCSLDPPRRPNLRIAPGAAGSSSSFDASLGLLFSLKMDGAGKVEIKGGLSLDKLEFSAELPVKKIGVTFEARADFDSGTADLESMEITTDGRKAVSIKAEVTDLAGTPKGSVDLFGLSLPAGLTRVLLGEALPGIQLAGESVVIDALRFSGNGQAGTLSVEGNLHTDEAALGGLVFRGVNTSLQGRTDLRETKDGWILLRPGLDFKGRIKGLTAKGVFTGQVDFSGRLGASPEGLVMLRDVIVASQIELAAKGSAGKIAMGKQVVRSAEFDLRLKAMQVSQRAAGGFMIADLGGTARLKAGRISGPGLVINQPKTELQLSGLQFVPGKQAVRLMTMRVTSDAGSSLLGKLAADSLAVSVNLGPGVLTPVFVPARLSLSVRGLRIPQGLAPGALAGPARLPGKISLGCGLTIFPRARKVKVTQLDLGISGIAEAMGTGDLDLSTSMFNLDLSLSPFRIEQALASLPGEISGHLPRIVGEAQLSAKLAGEIPRGRLVLSKLPLDASATLLVRDVGFSVAGIGLEGLSGQVEVQRNHLEKAGRIKTRVQLSAERAALADPQLDARGLSLSIEASGNAGDFSLAWKVGLARVSTGGLLPGPLENVSLSVDSRLLGMKELRLSSLELGLPSLGLRLNMEGRVERLARPETFKLGGRLDATFSSRRFTAWPLGISARGEAGLSFAVESQAEGAIETRGKINFENFDLKGDDFSLAGMQGGIPTSQRLAFRPAPVLLAGLTKSGAVLKSVSGSRVYEDALRPMKGAGRTFSIAKVSFKDLSIEKLHANLELSSGRLMLGSLSFSFLTGDVLADAALVFAPRPALRLKLDSELSAVDLSKLGAFALAGSSDIGGNLHLAIDWPARSVAASVNLTHIGRSTLQALLLAADPQETNPGAVELRRFLGKYQVSPRRVSVDVRHGRLQMEVVLKMGFAARAAARLIRGFEGTTFPIRHLQVGGLLSKYLGFE